MLTEEKVRQVNIQIHKKLYGNLALILQRRINWELIEKYYNEVARYIAALKVGTVEAEVMLKHLSNDNYNHPVYKALTEIGKAVKTIFLCKYIESEALRIEINEPVMPPKKWTMLREGIL